MQITALSQAIKDKERINVFVDGNFLIAIDKNTLAQEKLYVGKEISNEYLNQLKDLDTYNLITRKIINWALARPRSSKEVHEKVAKIISTRKSSSFNSSINIKDLNSFVIEKLNSIGINDRTFASWWIEGRKNQGKYGKQRIASELVKKGVSSSIIKTLISEHYSEDKDAAQNLLNKKFGVNSVKDIKDPKVKAKAYRFLASRGFKVI